jgi:hypothetical protein
LARPALVFTRFKIEHVSKLANKTNSALGMHKLCNPTPLSMHKIALLSPAIRSAYHMLLDFDPSNQLSADNWRRSQIQDTYAAQMRTLSSKPHHFSCSVR